MTKAIITDLNRCVGCLACSVACKAVNNVPIGSYWNKVVRVGPNPIPGGSGQYPDVYMYFLPISCQHCENPECVKVCPTEASHVAEDGSIQIDKEKCIGCQFCVMACPYGVRYLNEEEKVVEKCTLCEQKLSQGELPQCVSQCGGNARWIGDTEAGYESFEGSENLQMTALITSAVSLVVGGIGAFLHLEHWERIFNGFGHITSGITQELIGCVALAIVIVAWFVVLRGGKPVPKALAWATLAVAVLMVVATAHSYLMPARPAWGLALVAFYLGNACLLGAAAVWLISVLKKDEAVEATGIQLTFIAALVQIVADVVFVIACAMAKIAQFGYYADPTSMTTAPTHVDSLMTVMVSGAGAPMFWGSIVSVIVAAACAFVAKKKVGASKTLMVVAAIGALATSVMFRVLIYQLGYPVVLMY